MRKGLDCDQQHWNQFSDASGRGARRNPTAMQSKLQKSLESLETIQVGLGNLAWTMGIVEEPPPKTPGDFYGVTKPPQNMPKESNGLANSAAAIARFDRLIGLDDARRSVDSVPTVEQLKPLINEHLGHRKRRDKQKDIRPVQDNEQRSKEDAGAKKAANKWAKGEWSRRYHHLPFLFLIWLEQNKGQLASKEEKTRAFLQRLIQPNPMPVDALDNVPCKPTSSAPSNKKAQRRGPFELLQASSQSLQVLAENPLVLRGGDEDLFDATIKGLDQPGSVRLIGALGGSGQGTTTTVQKLGKRLIRKGHSAWVPLECDWSLDEFKLGDRTTPCVFLLDDESKAQPAAIPGILEEFSQAVVVVACTPAMWGEIEKECAGADARVAVDFDKWMDEEVKQLAKLRGDDPKSTLERFRKWRGRLLPYLVHNDKEHLAQRMHKWQLAPNQQSVLKAASGIARLGLRLDVIVGDIRQIRDDLPSGARDLLQMDEGEGAIRMNRGVAGALFELLAPTSKERNDIYKMTIRTLAKDGQAPGILYPMLDRMEFAERQALTGWAKSEFSGDPKVLLTAFLFNSPDLDFEESEKALSRLAERFRDDPGIHHEFGRFYQGRIDSIMPKATKKILVDKARYHFKKSTELSPTKEHAWNSWFAFEYDLDGPEARWIVSKALTKIESSGGKVRVLRSAAMKETHAEEWNHVGEMYEKLLGLAPGDAPATWGYARALRQEGRWANDEAIAEKIVHLFRRATELSPTDARIPHAWATFLIDEGEARMGRGMGERHGPILESLGDRGDPPEAETAHGLLNRAEQLWPTMPHTFSQRTKLLSLQRAFDAAHDEAKRAVLYSTDTNGSYGVWTMFADVMRRAKRYDKADSASACALFLAKFLAKNEYRSAASRTCCNFAFGYTSWHRDNPDTASAWYGKAIEIDPRNYRAYFYLAEVLRPADVNKALASYIKALQCMAYKKTSYKFNQIGRAFYMITRDQPRLALYIGQLLKEGSVPCSYQNVAFKALGYAGDTLLRMADVPAAIQAFSYAREAASDRNQRSYVFARLSAAYQQGPHESAPQATLDYADMAIKADPYNPFAWERRANARRFLQHEGEGSDLEAILDLPRMGGIVPCGLLAKVQSRLNELRPTS